MIYLDYAANTPVNEEVLGNFVEITNHYIANPNSTHKLGRDAKELMDDATDKIASMLGVRTSEIIYTSGATESNNLAIKGIANQYKKFGKHIITTYLEHSSVTGAITALSNQGYEVDFVDILEDGSIDLVHLKELLREDTILVSFCYVDSEVGIIQDINAIHDVIKEYPNCHFHVDATQAIGKIPVNLKDIDLITFTAHKFYGLDGCGVLIKKDSVQLEPMIHGGISTTIYRSGTPTLALIASTRKAMELVMEPMDKNLEHVNMLNGLLRNRLSEYKKVRINSPINASPYILNISIPGVKSMEFQNELEKNDVYVSTKSACCQANTASRPVYALTKDRKVALSTIRVSLSHYTTKKEIEEFLTIFDGIYKNLVK
ncbi:cysteine desulfurase family protein [Anaeromicropila herbilytica]|uniref:Aminotransferase V n=1 Tax=Anaeromicropila herbilytica TaxID=2785025 RepID=A0A7R7EKM1_9FIRM|nr:cysteine desulfurase family protein [Anaeromicropila herbilytica]BCN30479.1 aminotransferase V [Anaeromicropila herbilytica]